MIISIVSTTSAHAKVLDIPIQLKEPMTELGLTWTDWLLIEEKTLRAIKKDADGYELAVKDLLEAQKELNDRTDDVNILQREKHELQRDGYQKDVEIWKLKNPPVYKHPAFWGATGVGLGSVATVLILGLTGAFK